MSKTIIFNLNNDNLRNATLKRGVKENGEIINILYLPLRNQFFMLDEVKKSLTNPKKNSIGVYYKNFYEVIKYTNNRHGIFRKNIQNGIEVGCQFIPNKNINFLKKLLKIK